MILTIVGRVLQHMRLQSRVRAATVLICAPLTDKLVVTGSAPSSVPHLGSLSRRIGTSRPIDFDSIPSPSKTSRLGRSRDGQNSLMAKNGA